MIQNEIKKILPGWDGQTNVLTHLSQIASGELTAEITRQLTAEYARQRLIPLREMHANLIAQHAAIMAEYQQCAADVTTTEGNIERLRSELSRTRIASERNRLKTEAQNAGERVVVLRKHRGELLKQANAVGADLARLIGVIGQLEGI